MTSDMKLQNLSAATPLGVAGLSLFGFPIADIVQLLAAAWLVIQMAWFAYTKVFNRGRPRDTKED